jgi:hypothetical protein
MIVINVVPGSVTTGLWCPKCLLPSRYETNLYLLFESGPHCIGPASRCDGCAS